MGQMTYAVLLGVEMKAPKHLGYEHWWELCWRYGGRKGAKGPEAVTPSGDSKFNGIGFWCAVGASGERGIPDLEGFPLDEPGRVSKAHAKAIDNARAAWVDFTHWCSIPQEGGEGEWAWKQPPIKFPEPRLFLVQTEVA
jgi:hypothetical protein